VQLGFDSFDPFFQKKFDKNEKKTIKSI